MSLVRARSASSGLRAVLCAAALLAACAKPAGNAPAVTPLTGLDAVREGRGAGPAVALIPQPSGELVQLALWIDAGARDADLAQVATLAAWAAADQAGSGVHAEALPDGIELALPCKKAELASCLDRLARGLSLRRVEPKRLAALQARLVDARRRAEAADPARAADRLALEALYGGSAAAGLFPLGRAADDARASAALGSFLADHFGPSRALIVAAGTLDTGALDDAVARAFARVPHATKPRAADRPRPGDEDAVGVEVAALNLVSIAVAAPDLAAARGAAAALRIRLERDGERLGLRGAVRGQVFQLRGAALALLRARAAEPARTVRALAHELELLRGEGLPQPVAPAADHDLRALASRLGMRWIAHSRQAPAAGLALGLGVLVTGGRADKVSAADPDAAQRDAAREQLEAALEAGRALGAPSLHGDVDADSGAVTLDNGARLALRRRDGELVAVAVRFARGAGAEPPMQHGRAALLATLTATACAGLSPEQLEARLGELGAELTPRVDAESWGIALTAPANRWQPALTLALACALQPGLERRHLSSARLRLVERLGPEGGQGELSAAAADQLSPSAPGLLAPWGSPLRQAGVSLAGVRELWQQSRRGPLLSVAIVGALPLESAATWAARRLAEVDGAEKTSPKQVAPAAAHTPTRAAVDQPTLGLALWRVPGAADPEGALAFAALMRAALGQLPGVTPVWHDGGALVSGAWAAVALAGSPEPLAAAAAALRAASAALPPASLTHAADQAVERSERTRAAALASPASEAETLARAPFRSALPPASREQARALAARLAQAEPAWLPLR